MSVLPAGRPLERFLPDLDDLLADPRAYLEAGPVVVGPRRMYGLAALFAVPGLALLASSAVAGPEVGERLAMGVGLLAAAAVWLGWSLLLRGHELVLHPDGVEARHRDTAVWAPWALFYADGAPFVPDADSPLAGLTLPVNPDGVPFVRLLRDGTAVAYGAQVQARQWRFDGSDKVILPARYEVVAGELGALLLALGGRLGRQLPRDTPPREAYAEPAPDEVAPPDPGGWLTASLTRLRFPPRCCDCGAPTGAAARFQVPAPWDWLAGVVTASARAAEVQVPLCPDCQAYERGRLARAGSTGMSLGALLLGGGAVLLVLAEGVRRPAPLMLAALAGLAVGGTLGFLLGSSLVRDRPVRLRRYSPARGTLQLRFRNPEYAAQVVEAMRARPPEDVFRP